jgi:alpha,alpha-trehalase
VTSGPQKLASDAPRIARFSRCLVTLLALVVASVAVAAGIGEPETPSQLYGPLFIDVQTQRVFPDNKTFVDAVPRTTPAEVMQRYQAEHAVPGFDLTGFVLRNFAVRGEKHSQYRTAAGEDICTHIDELWGVLERKPDDVRATEYSSLLPLPRPYVVPGGRFDEVYYWDSYFTMLGLDDSGRYDLALDMAENFASLIERYGHIPNGNRTYYLSRSQPPFFASMVELIASESGDPAATYAKFLPALSKEYAYWMAGAETLAPGAAHRRVVRLQDGTLLNRYWDDRDSPREESYREDLDTAGTAQRSAAQVYRDLRAGAETGWDFSSRWLADDKTLATIHTTALLPVDLNSLLFHLERTLAKAYALSLRPEKAAELNARAELRRIAVQRYLWDAGQGTYIDYLWREGRSSGKLTAATLYPLFFGLATPAEAHRVAAVVRAQLLKPGGLVTTTITSGQQWDAPNGWAPLQWIGAKGLADYGERELARTIAQRWMKNVVAAYRRTGKLMEKYDVVDPALVGGGGEYPTQDGFGWTNGVMRKMLTIDSSGLESRCDRKATPVRQQ